jgi:DivIVA domain-containing protein
MDVSPRTLREVEFREKLRGYHPEDVDEFLERVAAGLEILQERLRQATERAVRAEQRATETTEADDAMRRTLVLAQRTADQAVQEAQERAARLLGHAEAQAQAVRAEAAEHARRTIEDATREAWAQVGRLETARDQLQEEIAGLQRYLDQERMRLRAMLAEAVANVDRTIPSLSPAPATSSRDTTGMPPSTPPAGEVPAPVTHVADVAFFDELRKAVGDDTSVSRGY